MWNEKMLSLFRSRDSDGTQARGSRERESRSDERRDKPFRDDRRDREEHPDRNGDYDGPPGMQPDGLIEVRSAPDCSLKHKWFITVVHFQVYTVVTWWTVTPRGWGSDLRQGRHLCWYFCAPSQLGYDDDYTDRTLLVGRWDDVEEDWWTPTLICWG